VLPEGDCYSPILIPSSLSALCLSGTPGRWNTFQFPGVLIKWA
jgi:hypothetical protein